MVIYGMSSGFWKFFYKIYNNITIHSIFFITKATIYIPELLASGADWGSIN